MDNTIVSEAVSQSGGLSPVELFLAADFVVKTVMAILLALSVWCWAVIVAKWRLIVQLNKDASDFEDAFWSGGSLDELYDRVNGNPSDPMTSVFSVAMREWRRAANKEPKKNFGVGLKERLDRVMSVAIGREMSLVEKGMTVLASTGSTAPFIGLFGTVWGIMNSFGAIAAEKTTNLAVVAPGIAEALFATAMGLFAAIPASLAYNKFAADMNQYSGRLETFAGDFQAILSRQIDEEG
ncbi:MAG: protein TolQ [Rhodospirillales bacterium]|jgi:biopolymer transport protein TolQ